MKTQSQDEVLRVTDLDRLSSTNSGYFKEVVKARLGPEHRIVEVDCTQVQFMDSDGLGALVSTHKLVAPREGHVRLTHVSPPVRRLLELLQFQQILEIND